MVGAAAVGSSDQAALAVAAVGNLAAYRSAWHSFVLAEEGLVEEGGVHTPLERTVDGNRNFADTDQVGSDWVGTACVPVWVVAMMALLALYESVILDVAWIQEVGTLWVVTA